MSTNKDYYKILGVEKNSSQEDLKKAYRKLAREHHPDVVAEKDKVEAEKRFKEINEAYRILSDPEKRKMYDQFGTADPNMGGFNGNGNQGGWGPFNYTYTTNGANSDFGDFDPFDIFEDFFGFRGFGSSRAPRKGKSLYYQMNVEFNEAVFGSEKEVHVESGTIKIKIPAGARDGLELKFSGKGMPGPNNAPAGDLFITLKINTPKEFKFYGDNILITKEIDSIAAALGAEVKIPVVDLKSSDALGTVSLKVPPATQYGSRLLVRGKGMPRLGGKGQGDIVVELIVVTPKRLTKKQKELLEEYQKS